MKSKLIPTFIVLVVTLGLFLGFSTGSNDPAGPKNGFQHDNTSVPPAQRFTAGTVIYVDSLNGANDTTSLKGRGYKPYYRGTGAQGLTATWMQGNATNWAAYNGPTTGYVFANYNVVTGTNNIDSWLVMPRLAGGIQAGDSLFFWERSFTGNTYPDSMRVMYSVSDSTPEGTWVDCGRFLADVSGSWILKGFRAPASSANGRFALRYCVVNGGPSGANSNGMGVDMITIERTAAPAPDPTTWYEIPSTTTGITTQINGVSAPDVNTIWACGASGKVIRSTNGGGNWSSAAGNLLASDIFYCLWAIDANTCLVSSSPSASNVYKTTNAGVNWTQVFTQPGGFIDGFYFKDASNGIMVGDATGGRWSLWRTTNGGTNWDSTGMNVPSTEASWTMAVYGIGNTVWFGGNTSKMYKTTNFGTNWTSLATGTEANGYSVWFNDLNNGMNGGATLQQTTNGGTTFTPNAVPGTGNIQGLCGVGTKWWVGRANIVYQSTNNGTAWTTAFTASGTSQIWNMTIARTGSPYIYAGRVNGTILKYGGLALGTPVNSGVVDNYSLSQNYPNPFNPTTSISFAIPQNGFVTLKVYNMLGKEVATLVNGNLNAGQHNYNFNASNLASGVYFYKLEAGNFSEVKKMSLIK